MKLKIRPLQRGKDVFGVEADPSETIYDLKLRISEHGFPVEAQNLLNTGKSLQDDKTIASCGIKEASTLVLMIKSPSAAVTPSASMSNSPRIAPGTLSSPSTVPGLSTTASANHLSVPTPGYAPSYVTPSPVPPVASSSSPKPISEMAQGPALSGAGIYSNVGPSRSNIDKITGMGFLQDQAVRALRASNDNVDQAVELLINDPHNLGANTAPRVAQAAPNSLANGFGLTNGTAPQTNGLPQSLIPQNLMNAVAQQQQLPDLSSMSLSTLGGSGDGGSGGATAEVTPEQIDEIRRLVASNPILIGPLLEQFKQEDPELYERVGGQSALTNPEKLLRVLGEGGDDSGPSVSASTASLLPPSTLPPAHARLPATAPIHAPLPQEAMQSRPGGQTLSVTQEEADQIEGIVAMGFDRQAVLQAYVACDRDAQRAVEFLLAGAFEE
jgi:UV excision repair protein RAD23